jgi:hypothetical protein
MTIPRIVTLHGEFASVLEYLNAQGEISHANIAAETFRKALLLSAASHFERLLCDGIVKFAAATNTDQKICSFVQNKAIKRQYHTFFDWDKPTNANAFYGLFGEGFSSHMKTLVKSDTKLDECVRAFIQLGADRNRVVHQDFASYQLEKTVEEIFVAFELSQQFVDKFLLELNTFGRSVATPANLPRVEVTP